MLREWAPIYVGMSRLGFTQTQVDDMELWVIEAILAAHSASDMDPTAPDPTGDGVPMTMDDFQRQSMAMLQQRLDAAAAQSTPDVMEGPTIAP